MAVGELDDLHNWLTFARAFVLVRGHQRRSAHRGMLRVPLALRDASPQPPPFCHRPADQGGRGLERRDSEPILLGLRAGEQALDGGELLG